MGTAEPVPIPARPTLRAEFTGGNGSDVGDAGIQALRGLLDGGFMGEGTQKMVSFS